MKKYASTQILGHGVFSTVYLGVDLSGNRVALKYYTNKDNQYIRQKFKLEANSLTQLQHENILPIYDFGEDDNGLYLAMEYCEYGSLKGRLDLKGALDLERTLAVCLSVVRALNVIHQAGQLHLDVRPENLFYSNDGFLKLADLGTLFNKVAYTDLPPNALYYASPEFLNKEALDFRTDIYSLGATIFHICTGRPVFESENIVDVINSHLTSEVPSLLDLLDDCPESIDAIIKKMMAKKTENRYQSLGEIEEDIHAVLEGVDYSTALPSFSIVEENVKVAAAPVLTPVNQVVESSFSEVKTMLDSDVLPTSSTTDIDVVDVLAEEEQDELKTESEPSKAKQLRLDEVKLSFSMRLLVACAWLVGPVILGLYVYKAYFSSTEKETVVAKPVTNEKLIISVDDFAGSDTEEVEKSTEKVEPKLEAHNIEFSSFKQKELPVVLTSIDRDNYFCSLKIRKGNSWTREIITLGQSIQGVKLIHLDADYAVLEYQSKGYKLLQNQTYNSGFELTVNNNSVETTFSEVNEAVNGFQLVSVTPNGLTLTDAEGKEHKLEASLELGNQAEVIDNARYKSLLKKSVGVVTSLVEFKHDYFPILINKIAPSKAINYSVFVNGTPVNYGNAVKSAVLNKKFQLRFIGTDFVIIKDLSNDKDVRLKANHKVFLQKAALVNYLGVDHKVKDGEKFFGYKAKVDETQISFTDGEHNEIMNETKILSFLPIKENAASKHKIKNCNCNIDLVAIARKLSEEKKRKEQLKKEIQKVPVKEEVVQVAERPEVADGYEVDKEYARRKIVNLQHFLNCSVIKLKHRKYSSGSSYTTYTIGHYLLHEGRIKHHPKFVETNKVDPNEFEVTSRSLKLKGEKFEYTHFGYSDGFLLEIGEEIYEIDFIPNNYFTVKRLLKYIYYVNMESETNYYLSQKYASKPNRKNERIIVKFDDENEEILINKIPFKLEFTEDYVYLVGENDRGYIYFNDYMYKLAR